MPTLGPRMYGSLRGSTSRKQREEMTPIDALSRKSEMTFRSLLFSTFRLLFIFASINKSFTVASHNLHSFKKTSAFHKQCLQQHGGIWMGQEHWLPTNRLSALGELGTQYTAQSGMEDAVSNGIMRGRPFGGVSIAWSPDMDHVIRPLTNKLYAWKQQLSRSLYSLCASTCLFSILLKGKNVLRKQQRLFQCWKKFFPIIRFIKYSSVVISTLNSKEIRRLTHSGPTSSPNMIWFAVILSSTTTTTTIPTSTIRLIRRNGMIIS